MSVRKKLIPQSTKQIKEFLKANGAPEVILRRDVAKYSCGFLHRDTLRNADSLGTGPTQRVIFGNKRQAVGYPLTALAAYMAGRGFVIESRNTDTA